MNANKLALYIAIFVCGLIAVCCGGVGARQLAKGRQTLSWDSTLGRIVDSTVVRRQNHGSKVRNKPSYHPRIEYRYEIGDEVYENDVIAVYTLSSNDRSKAQRYTSEYPAGATAKVFYNPSAPHESVLKPGTSFSSWILILVGVCFLLLMVMFFSIKNQSIFQT
jgi:hypothetical protein